MAIFGLLDKQGPDVSSLMHAVAAGAPEGTRPEILLSEGPVVLGGYVGRDRPRVARVGPLAVIVGGRLDAPRAGTTAAHLWTQARDAELLARLLDGKGTDALNDVFGDFVVAWFHAGRRELGISRTPFGPRALYAHRGSRFAFAGNERALTAMDSVSDDYDDLVVGAFLSRRLAPLERTFFKDLRRMQGGAWLLADVDGRQRTGSWFHPEGIETRRMTLEEAGAEAADLITRAVTDRARGKTAALLLSGGRDSGAVAVALARAGIHATCITLGYEERFGCREVDQARSLALELGHDHVVAEVSPGVTEEEAAEATRLAGGVIGPADPAAFLASYGALRAIGAEAEFDGQGGEPLFIAPPVIVLDLLRRGRLGTARAAARGFRTRWMGFSWSGLAKGTIRAVVPRMVLAPWDALRHAPPPWVTAPIPRDRRSRAGALSARVQLLEGLEFLDCLLDGSPAYSPLVDRRVVELAMALPLALRTPLPGPKPVLAIGLLGSNDASRSKIRFGRYFQACTRACLESFPEWFGPGSMVAGMGWVNPEAVSSLTEERWVGPVLTLASIESGLRFGWRGCESG